MRFSLALAGRSPASFLGTGRVALVVGLVGMLAFSAYGTLTPSGVRCGLPGAVGCPGGILGTAVQPLTAGEQWFTVSMYDWGFWIVDSTSGANETNSWNVFEGWTVHINATSLPPDAAVGGTAYHGLGVELNATGRQLLSLAAPVGKWTQGSFVAPNALYRDQHIWCTIQCGPGHGGQQAWVLNVVAALPSPKATASANATAGRAPLEVSFTGTASAGTPPFNTSWDFGDGSPIAYGLTASHTYLLGGNYSARFQVVDSKGMAAAATVGVLVNSTAPLTATVTATKPSAVVPFSTGLSVVVHGGAPPYSIGWTFGDGLTSSGTNLTSHLYAAPGVYAVVASVKDSGGSSVRAIASVSALPPLSYFPVRVTATPPSGSASVVVQFQATPGGGTAPFAYLWVFGDGTTGVGASVQHQYNQTGSYEINVFATDSAGHVGATATNLPVTANSGGGGGGDNVPPAIARPSAVALTVFPFTTPSDGGSPLLVNATASIEAGTGTGENVSWTFGDGTTGTGASVSHRFAAVGVYNVTIRATDSAGNAGTNTTVVRVQPLGMTLAVNRSVGDAPFSVLAAPTILGGTGRFGVVTWSWGDGTTSTGNLANHTYARDRTGPVTINATTTDSRGVSVASTATVNVFPLLLASLVPALPSTNALPVEVRFALSVTGGSGGYAPLPLWTFGDGSSTRGANPANHSYAKLGDYRVTVVTNDSLGTVTEGTAWVNLSIATPNAGGPGGSAPWSLTGVSDPNKAALVLIGIVGASGLLMLYRRRIAKPERKPPAVPPSASARAVKVPSHPNGARPRR